MKKWQRIIAAISQSPQALAQLRSGGGDNFATEVQTDSGTTLTLLRPIVQFLEVVWVWLVSKRTQQLAARRLRVAETISLGEKRFISILQVDGAQFLIGGAAGSVSLLAILNRDQGLDSAVPTDGLAAAEVKR
jgi:flagellar biogenesis protein FliO